MERSLRHPRPRARRREGHGPRFRATPRAPRARPDGGPEPGPLRPPPRARGDRAAGDRGCRDCLGGLPVGALARPAGEAQSASIAARVESTRAANVRTARRRSTSPCSPSGWTPTRATRPSSPPSTASAFAPSSGRRSRHGSRPSREPTRTRRCRRSPCPSTSSRPPRRPTASRRRPPASPARGALHPASRQLLARRRAVRRVAVLRRHQHPAPSPTPRMVILGLGYALFLGSLIWIATFPVSLSV